VIKKITMGTLLLCGSGLVMADEIAPEQTLEKAQEQVDSTDAPTTQMAPMQIRAKAEDAGYAATHTSSGTKTDTPVLETPMAVQTIPEEVLDDRQIINIQEAVKNVSGIQATTQFYDFFQIRGFFSYNSRLRNGLQTTNAYGGVDLAFVDKVEIAKGPTSMLYGRIEPGGIVNIVTKMPQSESAYSIEQQFGSWGQVRTVGDATGKLNEDGSLLYRVIGVYDKSNSFIDNVHHDNDAFTAMLSWKPNSQFNLNLQLEHYDTKMAEVFMGMGGQIPIIGNRPANLPRNFSSVDPALWSNFPMKVNRTLYAFDWDYAFNDQWKITNRFSYVDHKETQSILYGFFDGVDTLTNQSLSYQPGWKRKSYNTNFDLTGKFETGGIRHSLLVGLDWYRNSDDSPGSDGAIAGLPTLNIYNPVFANNVSQIQATINTDATNILWRDRSVGTGLYFQDQISLNNQWDILLGGRFDSTHDSYSDVYGSRDQACYPNCTGYPITPYPTDRAFSPRVGLLYKLTDSTSFYGSYSKSFGAANGRDNNGNPLKPQIGTQYELGVKASMLEDKVMTSATLFDLTKTNITEYDPLSSFPLLVGEVRSRGLELDISGQVTKHVSLIGSYTYDQAIITKDPFNGTQGNELHGVAPHVLSLWTKYDTAPGADEGWSFGAGVYLTAQRQGDDNHTFQLPEIGRAHV
jgi:iron complex outermembrane recepter protein